MAVVTPTRCEAVGAETASLAVRETTGCEEALA
jgi:hypothetical protein